MPDFVEQLNQIAKLRENCRKRDDELYRARLELHRTTQQVRQANQKPTVMDPSRDRQTANLRRQMSELEASLAALREEAGQLAQWFAALDEQKRMVEFLQQNLSAAAHRMEDLRQQAAELH